MTQEAASAPTRPLPPAPARPVKTQRRVGRIALGGVLIGAGTLGTVWYVDQAKQTVEVVAVAGALARGDVVAASDLVVVEIPDGPTRLRTIPSAHLEDLVGQVANIDIPDGSMLTPDSIVAALVPEGGTSFVGVELSPYQMPTEPLRAGDAVRIVQTPVAQGDMPPDSAPVTIAATVVSVEASTLGETAIVNVQVAHDDAAALAARAASGRVALVLDAQGERQ
jgi:hypothetical protein